MNYNNSNIDIKDKVVSQQSHATNDVTCGGSLESPTHRLSKKIEKSIFDGFSLSNPTDVDRNFIYRDENDNVMVVDKTPGKVTYLWKKITTIDEYVSGREYLIVYEPNGVIFDSSLSNLDSTPNTFSVVIEGDKIADSNEVNARCFIISDMADGKISILAKNGKYIGRTSNSNGIEISDVALKNTFDDSFYILGEGGRKLSFNTTSGQLKFRYESVIGAINVFLYRKTEIQMPDEYRWKTLVSNDDIDTISNEELDDILVPQCIDGNKMDC